LAVAHGWSAASICVAPLASGVNWGRTLCSTGHATARYAWASFHSRSSVSCRCVPI